MASANSTQAVNTAAIAPPGPLAGPNARKASGSPMNPVFGYEALRASRRASPKRRPRRLKMSGNAYDKKVAGIVSAHPGLKLDVEGHTDSVGGDDYNQQLSEHRVVILPGAMGDAVSRLA